MAINNKLINKEIKIDKRLVKILCDLRYVFEFLIALVLGISLFKILYYKSYFDIFQLKWTMIFGITMIVLLALIIFNFIYDKRKLQNLFLNFMIPIGIIYLIFLIPGYSPDEPSHIYRAYNISQGNIIVDTTIQKEKVPIELNNSQTIKKYFELNNFNQVIPDNNVKTVEVFNTFQIYAPIVYTFPSLAFFIGEILNMNILVTIYLARIFNFIVFLILGFYTIKIIPFGKFVTFVYLFIPMVIHQAVSVSADSFINATSLLFIAFILNLIFSKEKINVKQKTLFVLLALCVSFNKHIYLPLIFLSTILLFKNPFKDKKDKRFLITTLVVMSLIAIIWFLFGTIYVDVREYIIQTNVDSGKQIAYIIGHPLDFIEVIFKTIGVRGFGYIFEFLGISLGILNIDNSYVVLFIYLVMLISSPFFEKNKMNFNKYEKMWVLFITAAIYFLVLLGLYMGWTSVGKEIIDGVQGRYFIPIFILPLLCLVKIDKYIDFKYRNIVFIGGICLVNIYTLYKILVYFV